MEKIVEKFNLEDGRTAERHISVNEAGDKVIEVFTEDKKPLKLEKRIIEKRKEILSEQIVETVKDGEVVDIKVHSVEPSVVMQLRDHIGRIENSELNPSDYFTKRDLAPLMAQTFSSLMAAQSQNVSAQSNIIVTKAQQAEIALGDQIVAKKKNDTLINSILIGAIIIQCAVFGYLMFFR